MQSRCSVVWMTLILVGIASLSMVSDVCAQTRAAGPGKPEKPEEMQETRNVMAIVNGSKKITIDEVDSLFPSDVRSASERLESLRASALETRIRRAALADEARKRGLSLDAFLESLVPEKIEIERADVEREYLENGRSLGIVDEAEARVLLRIQLEAQRKVAAFRSSMAELRKRAEVKVTRAGVWQPKGNITQRGHSRGAADVPAVLTVFTDLECPYCKRAHEAIERLATEFRNNLRIVYKHFPLSIHRNAFAAAIASECAARQDRFWPYLDRLFAASQLSDAFLRKEAETLGLSMDQFDECRRSAAAKDSVLNDMRDARQAAVDSTPSVFLNGRMLKNPVFENLKAEIELEVTGQRTGSRTSGASNGEQMR